MLTTSEIAEMRQIVAAGHDERPYHPHAVRFEGGPLDGQQAWFSPQRLSSPSFSVGITREARLIIAHYRHEGSHWVFERFEVTGPKGPRLPGTSDPEARDFISKAGATGGTGEAR